MKVIYILVFLTTLLNYSCKDDSVRTIRINLSTMGSDVSFDQEAVQIPANKPINILFNNQAEEDSDITHNVAIIKPGFEKLVIETMNQEDYEFDDKLDFFKNKDYFIAVSKTINPQETSVIKIPGLKPGFYTYICLMPGHGNILHMRGKLYARSSTTDKGRKILTTDELLEFKEEFQRPSSIPFPEDNPYSKEKYDLGKKLFFDPILSKSDKISCATCHIPELNFEDNKSRSTGIKGKKLDRATQSTANLAWGELFFWDGRSESLEHQALQPVQSHMEMGLSLDEMEKKITANPVYRKLFKKAFNESPSRKNIAFSIATFERKLVSKKSPFDYWVEGKKDAISNDAKIGFELFNTKANCATCHSSWRFTDDSFHDIGVNSNDEGRGKELPQLQSMKFAFKTPSLRNVINTAPYFHDGSVKSIEDIIEFYDHGGDVRRASLSSEIKQLHLSAKEKKQIISFLKTLSSDVNMEGL